MFAVQYLRFGGPDVLEVGQIDQPHPGPGEVRIAVRASGITGADTVLRSGGLRPDLKFPHIPGVDAAGVVDEIGLGVTGVAIGDEVFGAVDVMLLGGAAAEFAVLQFWAPKPPAWSWAEAGGAATSVETATRTLDALGIGPGSTLLIEGASGAVGSVAVQLAVARGVRVVGTGSPQNQDLIAELGGVPTTYGPGLPVRVAKLAPDGVDAALDVAGAGSLPDLLTITGDAAKVLTIADFTAPDHGVRLSYSGSGQPDGRHGLSTAARLAAEGRLRIIVRDTFGFGRAAEAHARAEDRRGSGKVVLTVS
ncbi:NADP-dependent oxidoreductase [Streptomyces malaysiensis]|uniref:NADP-dependent oxidoreductase n=1 Tax=Streptomyces malaysiensis TaxID=92644 RepID=UPI00368D7743